MVEPSVSASTDTPATSTIIDTYEAGLALLGTEVKSLRLAGRNESTLVTQLPFLIEAVLTGVAGALIAVGGLVVGKFLFIDQLLSGIVANGVVPPIEVADIVWSRRSWS